VLDGRLRFQQDYYGEQIIQSSNLSTLAAGFQRTERQCVEDWRTALHLLRQDGPVALLGAAGKGVALANLVDPAGELISCIVDVNPHKQHKYLPGTGHLIIPYEEIHAHGIASVVLLSECLLSACMKADNYFTLNL
jgi:hypothetical protein